MSNAALTYCHTFSLSLNGVLYSNCTESKFSGNIVFFQSIFSTPSNARWPMAVTPLRSAMPLRFANWNDRSPIGPCTLEKSKVSNCSQKLKAFCPILVTRHPSPNKTSFKIGLSNALVGLEVLVLNILSANWISPLKPLKSMVFSFTALCRQFPFR